MIITDIKSNKKEKILIFADGEYLFSIPLEVFMKNKLKKGDYIDEEIMQHILCDVNANKAKEKALRLLSLRAHSKKELKDKIKNSADEISAESAVQKMEDLGLIDDYSFAKSYACELSSKKYYSIKRIEFELSKKGISSDIVNEVLNEVDIDEEENVNLFLEKKYFGKQMDEKTKRRMIAALERLGYAWHHISYAINKLS